MKKHGYLIILKNIKFLKFNFLILDFDYLLFTKKKRKKNFDTFLN